jgi:tRNA(Ile2)-agmatinylcytidine synthase
MGWLGLDDTDHLGGGCTTLTMHRLLVSLPKGVQLIGDPSLVRLYPMAKARTRGNAALSAELKVDLPQDTWYAWLDQYWSTEVEPLSGHWTASTHAARPQVPSDPGMVWYTEKPPDKFYRKAVRKEVRLDEGPDPDWSRGGQGRIGAMAAVAWSDHATTWEGIAWRERDGTTRRLDEVILRELDGHDRLFACRDPRQGRGLLAPRGASPVLCGIRGTERSAVSDAMDMLLEADGTETASGHRVFRTNQGSGDHLSPPIHATVMATEVIQGGHVALQTDRGTWLAFAPSGMVRDLASRLCPGDEVQGLGLQSTKPGREGLHLEALQHIAGPLRNLRRPTCPACRRRMKSAGKGQGLRCPSCDHTDEDRWVGDEVIPSGWVQPPLDRRRHLAPDLSQR